MRMFNRRLKLSVFLLFIVFQFIVGSSSVLAFNNPFLGDDFAGMSGSEYMAKFLPAVIALFLLIGAFVFLFMIIQGGIEWINSGGDKAGYESARNRINNAFIGILILFSLFAIINLIEIFFGVNISVFNVSDFAIK